MSVTDKILTAAASAITKLYGAEAAANLSVSQTKPEFTGEYTVVLFALVKSLKLSPDVIGAAIGDVLLADEPSLFTAYNMVKGFLNLSVADSFYTRFLSASLQADTLLQNNSSPKKIIVEYSSPNTNKPLHLGHLRNNFLGWSNAELLKATGNEVVKTCIVNDRGIHICKSMIAWQLFGAGATPQSTGIKGDHFVGDYYVKCEGQIKAQAAQLSDALAAGNYTAFTEAEQEKLVALNAQAEAITGNTEKDKERAKKIADDRKEIIRSATPVMRQAQQMLVDWEAGKPEVLQLWKQMNGWVYEGFDATYKRIGSDFDIVYYESETYLLGKESVEEGLAGGAFFKKEDGSVWINLMDDGLDEKLVLRRDGTSVYITQDLGLAQDKYEAFPYDKSLYVIADEQAYHMKVLEAILKRLHRPYAAGIVHLSYGMVELPTGRMKSREGTVVDADDLIDEMVAEAAKKTSEKSKVEEFSAEALAELYETIALGALKFFLLKVDPKKRMVFNPEESIDFHGFTGPFIQYTHARLKSILRKAGNDARVKSYTLPLLPLEKNLLVLLEQYNSVVQAAAAELNPAAVANYIYAVAKTCNSFYTEHKVLTAENEEKKALRLALCELTSKVIKEGMGLLGIKVPEKM